MTSANVLGAVNQWGFFLPSPMPQSVASGTVVTNANEVYVYPVFLANQVAVGHVALTVTATQSGGVCDVGLYSTGGSLIANTGGFSVSSYLYTRLNLMQGYVQLPAGWYWHAQTCSVPATAFEQIASSTPLVAVGNQGMVKFGTAANAATAGVLPSSLGTITSGARNLIVDYWSY